MNYDKIAKINLRDARCIVVCSLVALSFLFIFSFVNRSKIKSLNTTSCVMVYKNAYIEK